MTETRPVEFPGADGSTLVGRLELPDRPPRATALFAHCFTCGKDVAAASRIARALRAEGFAVLRFDFTGLGESEGDFVDTTFSTNIDDLVRAADHLRATLSAPSLLIGHSLGGAAVLAAAAAIPEARAVVTIAAPADPHHVTHLFGDQLPGHADWDDVEVTLAGRPFRVSRRFLDDIDEHPQRQRIAQLDRALLVMHSPTDAVVGIDNAGRIFEAARHPKSFVALDGADHLLTRREDAQYVADIVAAWVHRYLPDAPSEAGV